ncbi:MAG: 30S ribosomal protein S20 [Holosporales bacterium]|jgi:small subunit ribosomal protein S20
MAQHISAQKRIRTTAIRTEANRARLSRVRTFIRKVEAALNTGDVQAATAALREAQPEIHRGVTKGVLHGNTASRTVSRLAKRLKKIAG